VDGGEIGVFENARFVVREILVFPRHLVLARGKPIAAVKHLFEE